MTKILTVIGARPQIIKAAAFSRAVSDRSDEVKEVIVHTGQHYDELMSDIFFEQMGIPKPDYNLAIGSGNHGAQTGRMIEELEDVLLKEKPDAVLVYGDTNSTLAASLAAVKLHIPVAHVEAGLRSFNKSMPEEINRIITDHCSRWLFLPTEEAQTNLANEGLVNHDTSSLDHPRVIVTGDVMYDNAVYFGSNYRGLERKKQILFTCHRPSNTESYDTLVAILQTVVKEAKEFGMKVLWPIHPRILKWKGDLEKYIASIALEDYLEIVEPLGYLEMLQEEKASCLIVTDSGGVQKEAFFSETPCVVLRDETEWVELVENGNSFLAGSDPKKIQSGIKTMLNLSREFSYPNIYGNGYAASKILDSIVSSL